jgi:hypothetical protein
MRYEVTGLAPARIEVSPGGYPDIRHSDLTRVEVFIYKKDSELESEIPQANWQHDLRPMSRRAATRI